MNDRYDPCGIVGKNVDCSTVDIRQLCAANLATIDLTPAQREYLYNHIQNALKKAGISHAQVEIVLDYIRSGGL